MRPVLLLAFAAPLVLGGCLAKTALDVATAPVKVTLAQARLTISS